MRKNWIRLNEKEEIAFPVSVWKDSTISYKAKLVLMALRCSKGKAPVDQIAHWVGMCSATVRKYIKELINKGYIVDFKFWTKKNV